MTILVLALACAAPASGQAIDEAAVEKALKERAEAQNAAKAAEDAQRDAQVQQYVKLMQPLMWRELEFVRQTCDLTPEQRPKIKAAAETSVKQAARDMFSPLRPTGRTPTTAGQMIRSDVAKALAETLTPDQLARYQAEATKRATALKQATVQSVVAQLDTALYLTEEQRDKVTKSLTANWQEEWEQWLKMWQYAGRYFPQVPDQHVTPHLTDEQKILWRGLQKVSVNSWGSQVQRPEGDDEWWQGKAVPAAAKAAAN